LGTWWQGEIAGEYFLSNSNLISHQARLHLTPSDAVSGGLMASPSWPTSRPRSAPTSPRKTSRSSWTVCRLEGELELHFQLPRGDRPPQEAVIQGYDRSKNFIYGMFYITYAY